MSCSCNKNYKYTRDKPNMSHKKHNKKNYKKHKKNNYKKNNYKKYNKKYSNSKKYKYGKPHHNNHVNLHKVKGDISKLDFAKTRSRIQRKKTYGYHENNIYKNLSNKTLKSWDTIHNKSKNAITKEKKDEFVRYMNFLADNFPCPTCINHIRNYLGKNPISKYYNVKENNKDIGMLKWSWEFHNDVSKRLNKQVMTWEEFSVIYM